MDRQMTQMLHVLYGYTVYHKEMDFTKHKKNPTKHSLREYIQHILVSISTIQFTLYNKNKTVVLINTFI